MSSGRKSRRPPEQEAAEPCDVTPASGSGDPLASDLHVSYIEDINGNIVRCIFIENARVSRLQYLVIMYLRICCSSKEKRENPSANKYRGGNQRYIFDDVPISTLPIDKPASREGMSIIIRRC